MARLNVIWVYADDAPWDSFDHMPWMGANTDCVSFPRSVNVCPICGPSRMVSITGMQARRGGFADNRAIRDAFMGGLDPDRTIGPVLGRAGYQRWFLGKPMNGWPWAETTGDTDFSYAEPGWDHYATMTPNNYINAYEFNIDGVKGPREGNLGNPKYRNQSQFDKAKEWITDRDDRPFVLYLPLYSPHTDGTGSNLDTWQIVPAPEDAAAPITLADAPSFNEADIADKPAWVSAVYPTPLNDTDTALIRTLHTEALRAMIDVDRQMEDLVDTFLAAEGLADNTVVIYSTDNANTFGEHRHSLGKGVPYMEAIDCQIKVWWPGVTGRDDDALVTNMDIPATIADIAGAEFPDAIDGMSFAERVTDPTVNYRDAVLIEKDEETSGGYGPPAWTAIYTGDWIYTEYDGDIPELYDLTADPGQTVNLQGLSVPQESSLAADLATLQSQQITSV